MKRHPHFGYTLLYFHLFIFICAYLPPNGIVMLVDAKKIFNFWLNEIDTNKTERLYTSECYLWHVIRSTIFKQNHRKSIGRCWVVTIYWILCLILVSNMENVFISVSQDEIRTNVHCGLCISITIFQCALDLGRERENPFTKKRMMQLLI